MQRLAPSLAQYKGGTVIDYHPGACLFSSKIHDLLKPKNHILIEPQYSTYASFIKPLLDESESRYSHRTWTDERIWLPKQYIEEGLIPKLPTESENATLFIVNATGKQIRTSRDESYQISDSLALKFTTASRYSNDFHARGPTRLLLWCDDGEKNSIIPRTVDWRRKLAALVESHCHAEEVVGFGTLAKGAQREQSLIAESARLVQNRMIEKKIRPLPQREITQEVAGYSGISRYWHHELRDLEARFDTGELSQFVGAPPGPIVHKSKPGKSKAESKLETTPEYQRLVYLQRILMGQNAALARVQPFVDEQAAIDSLDLRSYTPSLGETEKEALLSEIDRRTQALKDSISRLSMNKEKQFKYLTDDRHALQMAPGPLLMWDQRSYEPLTATQTEFYKPGKMALLDFQAKPQGTLPLNNEQSLYFDLLVSALFAGKGSHDLSTLKNVAPGAYEDLVPRVTELGDARKGGRRHGEGLRNRTLTPKMLWRLAMEWDSWVFKPEMRDLVGIFRGNEAFDFEKKRRT